MSTNFLVEKAGKKNRKLFAGLGTAAMASILVAGCPVNGASVTPALAASAHVMEIQAHASQQWASVDSPQTAPAPARQNNPGGFLGVAVDEVTPETTKNLKLTASQGVLISRVGENSPAAKAGLKMGDVILEYNGEHVAGPAEFRRLVRATAAGQMARLLVWRDGHSQMISAEIGSVPADLRSENGFSHSEPGAFEQPSPWPGAQGRSDQRDFGSRTTPHAPVLGVAVQDLSGQLGQYFGAPDGEGVLVTEVRKGSAAEKAGLKAGDVITKVNGERVQSSAELQEHLAQATQDDKSLKIIHLGVIRKGAETEVAVQPEMPNGLSRRIPL